MTDKKPQSPSSSSSSSSSSSASTASPAKEVAASAKRYVPCPTCGGPSLFNPSNPFRPFCSDRCKQIDLGAWANEEFKVPTEAPPEDNIYGDPKLDSSL